MEIILIASVAANGVIGRNNALPWHLPEDMAHFKRTTWGHTVIMGRKTYQSIGHPLSGRRNIILASDPALPVPPDCLVMPALPQALQNCMDSGRVFLIGGARLFREGLRLADTLILTHIHATIEGDVFFPPFSSDQFRPVRHETIEACLPLTITTYRRVETSPALPPG